MVVLNIAHVAGWRFLTWRQSRTKTCLRGSFVPRPLWSVAGSRIFRGKLIKKTLIMRWKFGTILKNDQWISMADVPYFNLLGAGKGGQKLRIVHRVGQLHEPFMVVLSWFLRWKMPWRVRKLLGLDKKYWISELLFSRCSMYVVFININWYVWYWTEHVNYLQAFYIVFCMV